MTLLLPVAEARARVLALARLLPVEDTPLAGALNRFAAADVLARRVQPAADVSAMDGYAVRFDERPGPWRVAGESTPGRLPTTALQPGEAMRIFTGAPLPDGADTVVIQEEMDAADGLVRMTGEGPAARGGHVRRAGSDLTEGDLLIATGDRITPARIALAATGGHGTLPLHGRARVAILSTGDELVPPGAPTAGLDLPSSNAPMLAALLAALPVIIDDRGIVRDALAPLARAFEAAAGADVIVTTGGASVGDHDLVRPALIRAGAALDFWRVAMKPGKPLMGGTLDGAVVLGLPGNPVSAFVTAHLFLLPLIAAMTGTEALLRRPRTLPLGRPLPGTGVRAEYLRARIANGEAVALAGQDSAGLRALAEADALIVRPPHAPAAQIGDPAEILMLA